MALRKIIPLPYKAGLVANYVRVDSVFYDRRNNVLEIGLGYYMDEDSAIGERPPVGGGAIRLTGEDAELVLAALHDTAGPLVYGVVKGKEEFEDATDLP